MPIFRSTKTDLFLTKQAPVRRYNHMKKYIVFSLALVVIIVFNIQKSSAGPEPKNTPAFIDKNENLITNTKQLTFVGSRSGEGYFSADGKKMIYQSEREEGNPFYQIFLLDLESGKSSRLSTGKGMTTCSWVHPNLKKAMWSSTHLDPQFEAKVKAEYEERAKPVKKRYSWSYDETYDIFESDLSGKKIKRLTKELGYDAEGSYSPDGKFIAFASNRSRYGNEYNTEEKKILEKDASYAMEIYIMNADGTNVKRLTQSKGYDGGPFFSADGTKITWRRFSPDGSRAEIYTMNTDGSDQRQITKINAMSWAPFFHPSGRYIIFTTSALGYTNFELFIVEAEGNGLPIRVSFEEDFDGLPTFSPDGKRISWTHRNEKGESQIYMADWDHEKAIKLVEANVFFKKKDLTLSSAVTEADAKKIISYLASEEFKGRQTGSDEEKIYTAQIAELFKKWGLEPLQGQNFIQTFEFTSSVKAVSENSLQLKGRLEKTLIRGEDYQIISYSNSGEFNAAPLVFVGYGIKAPATDKIPEFNSYRDTDVKNKWVLMLDYVPELSNKEQRQHLMSYSQPQHKVSVAKNQQAAGVIIVTDSGLKDIKFEGSLSESSLPVVKISTKILTEILKKSDTNYKSYESLEKDFNSDKAHTGFVLSSQYVSAKINLEHNKSIGRNVIAKLSVPNRKAKALMIGAHGDHLGQSQSVASSLARADEKGKIHYGADDNASGVAGVLELAHYFSEAKNRARLVKPLYFAVWSGEEIGVLGSNFFVKDWKTRTKTEIKDYFEASLNMDMIGRLRDKVQVQGVASAKEWSGLGEEVSLVSGLPLVLTNDPYLPTDAISFYMADIPSISFFTGTHEEYHSPRDTAETINFSGLVKVIDIVKLFSEKIATVKSNVVSYQKVQGDAGKKMEGRSFRIYLGTIPDYSQEGVKGVRISGASKNSPAEKAGLRGGDIIVGFDKVNIENLYDYVYALQSAKPNRLVLMNVLREGKLIEVQITPLLKE